MRKGDSKKCLRYMNAIQLGHEAYRNGLVGSEREQKNETYRAVKAHTEMTKRMLASSVAGSAVEALVNGSESLQKDLEASRKGDRAFREYVDETYDSTRDSWAPMISSRDFFGFVLENEPSVKTTKLASDALGGDESAQEQLKSMTLDKIREEHPYLSDSIEQVLLGNYTDKCTALGTAGQVLLGVFGVDAPLDVRDFFADIGNWDWSWKHAGQTALDAVALIPVVGAVKYADEAAALVKNGNKALDAGTQAAKNADEVGEASSKALKTGSGCTKPEQLHHFATDKNKIYKPQFEEISKKYGLDLDNDWNKDYMPHQGRHPNEYHEYVLEKMKQFDNVAQGDKDVFLHLYENMKTQIKNSPDMLYKEYWRNGGY